MFGVLIIILLIITTSNCGATGNKDWQDIQDSNGNYQGQIHRLGDREVITDRNGNQIGEITLDTSTDSKEEDKN